MTAAAIKFHDQRLGTREQKALAAAIRLKDLAGHGETAERVAGLLRRRLHASGALLTTSCTAALELAFKALRLRPGDEVILPSFAYVSDANAILAAGGRPVFADVQLGTLNLDPADAERRIGKRTRAILLLHYGGVACDMAAFRRLARRHRLALVEDAALALGGKWRGLPLGTVGDVGCFSFHASKPVTCGKGGALVTRRPALLGRIEILASKGTDRSAYLRGERDRYTWHDAGSSYRMPGLLAALLEVQLGRAEGIQRVMQRHWRHYQRALLPLQKAGLLRLAQVPPDASPSYSVFWFLLQQPGRARRDRLLRALQAKGIPAASHYEPLHLAPFGRALMATYPARLRPSGLAVTERCGQSLVRLPLHAGLSQAQVARVCLELQAYFGRPGS